MQFLTEEKQFDTLGSNLDSKHNEAHLKTFDISSEDDQDAHSPRISDLRPENIQARYEPSKRLNSPPKEPKIDEQVLRMKLEEERELLNREWESKLDQEKREHKNEVRALEQINQQYAKDADQVTRLREEMKEMKQLNEKLMEKYEKSLQDNIDRIKREEEDRKRNPQINSQYADMKAFAEQNIANPMDLSMSIVIKEGMKFPPPAQGVVVQTEKYAQLDKIFEKQKAIKSSNHYSDSEDEEVNKLSVFKLQEFLIETENPDDISKPLLL